MSERESEYHELGCFADANECGLSDVEDQLTEKLIYLATPYNHPDSAVRESRFRTACKVASHFMSQGIHLFCPIAHTHPIAESGDLPKGWDYWQVYDRVMLRACSELWVVKMDGWDLSVGIKGELEIARELGLTIKYVIYTHDPVPDLVVINE